MTESKDPITRNGVELRMDQALRDFDGTDLMESGHPATVGMYLIGAVRRNESERPVDLMLLGVKVEDARKNGNCLTLDGANLEIAKRVVQSDGIRLASGERMPFPSIYRGQVLQLLEGR